jgi:beta-lactamase superfamily II metal-dependent hydrolase
MVKKMSIKAAIKAVWAVGLLCLLSFLALLCGAEFSGKEFDGEPLEVIFPALSDGSTCTIMLRGTSAWLIDAGSESDAPRIMEILREFGVSELSAIILTCPDDSLIGGADVICREFPAKLAVIPDFHGDSAALEILKTHLRSENTAIITPKYNRRFSLCGVSVTVLPPLEGHYNIVGNYSLGVLAIYNDTKMFFAGNADKKRTSELLRYSLPEIDLYKVANFGKLNDYSAELIEKLSPATAVIAASRADKEILDALSNTGADVLHLDDGRLIITVDSSGVSTNLRIHPD